jgi:hypothetical protein
LVALAVDGTVNPTILYMESSTNLIGIFAFDFVSYFKFFHNDQNFSSLAVDTSTSPPTVYTAADNGTVYKSTDRGNTFAQTNLADQPAAMTLVAIAPPTFFAGEYLEDDAIVAELNPTGTALTFSTYLQGASQDVGSGIAVDPAGTTIHAVGETASTNFPVAPNPGAVQLTLAGNDDAFLSVLGPPMQQGGSVPPPPPPINTPSAKAGSTVPAGSLLVNNTSGAPLLTPSVTIAFDNADLFTSATLTATVGTAVTTSTVVPSDSTTFIFNPPVMIPLGGSVTYSLQTTITTTPNITRLERPIAYASIIPGGGSRVASTLVAAMAFLSIFTALTGVSRPRRLMFALVLLLLAVTTEVGCDNGSIGSPTGPQFSTQTANDVAAKNQTGGPVLIGGLPVVMSTITVP